MTDSQPAILSVADVAARLDCADDTVRELARAGTLPGLKVGRDWVFPAGALWRSLEALAEAEAAKRRAPAMPLARAHAPDLGRGARRGPPPALPSLR